MQSHEPRQNRPQLNGMVLGIQMRFLFLFLITVLALGVAEAGLAAGQQGWPCYIAGAPIRLVLEYTGGVEGWDAGIGENVFHNREVLVTWGQGFLVVTRGLGEFDAQGDKRGELLAPAPPRGVIVAPKKDRQTFAKTMVTLSGEFRKEIELSKFYPLSEPGIYTVWWGCRGLSGSEIMFEVVPE